MRLLFLITRAHEGGAQEHVLTLLRGLSDKFETVLATGERGYLTEGASELGIPVHIIGDLAQPIHLLKDYRAGRQVLQLIRDVKPDLIHTHSFKSGILGRMAGYVTGTPALFTAHSWAFADGVSWGRKVLAIPSEWLLAKVTSHIITVSNADHRLGLQYGVAADSKMTTVLNGVDPVRGALARTEERVPRIVMVARFSPPKDHSLLLRALREVDRPFEVWFAGDGALRERVEQESRALGLGDQVRFFGTCRNVPEMLAQSDIFVLTSRYEGLPISILEAMRAGLPVIATDVGGVSECVAEGATGFLVPRGDCGRLRDRITGLLDDRELRRSLGMNGRKRFEREFSSQIMVESTQSIYEQVVFSARFAAAAAASRSVPTHAAD